MEDIFSVVIVLLIYAAVVGSVRKSAKRKRGDKKRARRKPQFEAAFEAAEGKKEASDAGQVTLEDVRKALVQAARSAAPEREAAKREPDCRTSRLHLHEATQEQMDDAGEGEDPCHGGHAPEPAPAADFFDGQENETLSQDVLRGVIMSEILTRPCERRKRSPYGR